jgi:hypothetical protein
MIKRHHYRTPRMAVRFFLDSIEQGFSPSLVAVADGFEVSIWRHL